jgi:hypothetical protein
LGFNLNSQHQASTGDSSYHKNEKKCTNNPPHC